MLVYGDTERELAPAAMIAGISAALAAAGKVGGIQRHGWLVEALIEAGMLAQGIADHAFATRGEVDGALPEADAALDVTRRIARSVALSWRSSFSDWIALKPETLAAGLSALRLPGRLRVRMPEGFAHYCVYPESYMEAARALPAESPMTVIGIRSIGTTLAAMVAESVVELSGVITLRPVGHPFDRRIAADADLVAALSQLEDADFAIVDEGPGLSGSSVSAVADLLAEAGIAEERLHVLPSHAGEPGPRSSPRSRHVWSRLRRHVVSFDDLVLGAPEPAHRLASWCADLVGGPPRSLVEISGGEWRRVRYADEADWPPVHPWQERRKFLLGGEAGSFLLKFAGLGQVGRGKYEIARRLHAAGFVPEPFGFRHGFLVERWIDRSGLVAPTSRDNGLVGRLGDYLGFRAGAFPAPPGLGASVHALFDMLRHNTAEACGTDLADATESWRSRLDVLERRRRPVLTDNRLHAWEWLRVGATLLKSDAVDHHAGHDLVGPQDIAWDVAGATVEFELSPSEQAALIDRIARAGIETDAELVAFMTPCYLAFQLGAYTMAIEGSSDRAERSPLRRAAQRYRDGLVQCAKPH